MAIEYLAIETPIHGRVVVHRPAGEVAGTLVAFHGYAQGAEELMSELKRIPGHERFMLVSVQALHRFYARGDERVVASWMTRQDREQAIADNVEYVNRALDSVAAHVGRSFSSDATYLLGFSQGVAMAYRAGLLSRHRVSGIIAVGGDVPPDVKGVPADHWPRVFVAAGATDHWYTPDKVLADETFLRDHPIRYEILRYNAGHVFTDEVRSGMASFINS